MKLTEQEFLDAQIQMGIGPHNPKFVNLAKKTVAQLSKYKGFKAIDYGSGTGVYANELANAGFDVIAQDIMKVHRDFIKDNYEYFKQPRKVFAKPVRADLMLFIETAEHMEDYEIKDAIFAIEPKVVLFSSTSEKTDNDEAWSHINIKEQSEWIKFWKGLGFRKIQDFKLPTKWTMLLERI